MSSLSILIHVQTSLDQPESIVGQAFFVNAEKEFPFARLYRIVHNTIYRQISLRNELAGKPWNLYQGKTYIPNDHSGTLSALSGPTHSSLNITLVV